MKRLVTIGKLLLLSGIFVTAGLLSAFIAMRFAVRGTEVEVPSIRGKSAEQAKELLSRGDLKLGISGERYDSEIPEGAVISQHPSPGVRIKARREVQVILSSGKRRNPIPELRGSTLRAAQLMVLHSGYELGNISEIAVEGVPKHQIVQQFPSPDSKEIVSPKIDILVGAEAPARYIMPDVVGQDLIRVLSLFEKAGFKIGKIEYRPYQNVAKGAVVKQYPEPGYLLQQTDAISLEVAR